MAPEATEETDHVWLHDGEQSVNLTAEVAEAITAALRENDGYFGTSKGVETAEGVTEVGWPLVDGAIDPEALAKVALEHPHIRKALDLYSRIVTLEAEIEGRKAF